MPPQLRANRILIIDDHSLVCELTAWGLARSGGYECHTALDIDAGIRLVKEKGPFDAILLDLRMPGESAASGVWRVHEADPETPVVIFSGNANDPAILEGLSAGAKGFAPKSMSMSSLSAVIRLIIEGNTFVPDDFAQRTKVLTKQVSDLNEKETILLREFARGRTMKELSRSYGYSVPTIKAMSRRIYTKLGTSNRAHAVMRGKELRII